MFGPSQGAIAKEIGLQKIDREPLAGRQCMLDPSESPNLSGGTLHTRLGGEAGTIGITCGANL